MEDGDAHPSVRIDCREGGERFISPVLASLYSVINLKKKKKLLNKIKILCLQNKLLVHILQGFYSLLESLKQEQGEDYERANIMLFLSLSE